MNSKHLTKEQKEFYSSLSELFQDSITDIQMVNLQCDSLQWKNFPIKPTNLQTNLWCLLVFGENDIHIYVNPTEQTILGFRVNASMKPPEEQLFSFSQFSKWNVTSIFKKSLFGYKEDKFRFQLHYTINNDENRISNTIVIETNTKIQPIIHSINKYLKTR